MIKTYGIAALILSTAGAIAQTPPQADYQGQSWVGLLVSASCDKGGKVSGDPNKANRESDLTMNGRTTTPAVDQSGTRGSSNALGNDSQAPSEKQTMPATGDVIAKSKSIDPGWGPARKQAQSLGSSCTLDANATQFALLLADGTMLQFDELANQAIAKQMPAMPAGAKSRKVLRVSVQGKMQSGKIALNSIQM